MNSNPIADASNQVVPDTSTDAKTGHIDTFLKTRELLWTIGTVDGWNCHTLAGFGLRLDPKAGGEVWDWSAARSWRYGVGTGQAESRDEAVRAALVCLAEAELNIYDLPSRL